MHTSVILSEALRYFIDSEHFELSVVLFAVAVERLMFNLNIEEDEAVTDKHELKRIREERDRRKAALIKAALIRLGNMRNNMRHTPSRFTGRRALILGNR